MRLLVVLLLGMNGTAHGAAIYSYVDPEGVRVITNLGSEHLSGPDGSAQGVEEKGSPDFLRLVEQVASRYGVNRSLVRAIIEVESNWDPWAVSPKNCKGLMQLHPETARRFGVDDIFDPAQNIEGGVKYLSYLIDSFDERLDYVLAAYNAGENAVRHHQGIPPFPETIGYVKKVQALFARSVIEAETVSSFHHKIQRLVLPSGQILFTNALQ